MKYIKTIAVITILIILPLGSWYFLQRGLDWRKEKRDQLVVKKNLTIDNGFSNVELDELTSILNDKTTLVVKASKLDNKLNQVVTQFDKSYTFQYVHQKDLPQGVQPIILEGNDYALIDTGMQVLQYYSDSKADLRRLVEDLSLTIPKRKEKDIKLKKNRND